MPRNFSWVIPGRLGGVSIPKSREQIEFLDFVGVEAIFTVLDEEELPKEFFAGLKVKNYYLPVPNYFPPTKDQVDFFIEKTEEILSRKKGGVIVHCGGGKGRAGTFLACYLLKHGLGTTSSVGEGGCRMSASEAIELLRKIRPGSVETHHQEKFISDYANELWKNSLECEEEKEKEVLELNVAVLVGIPGSGKSYFAKCLAERLGWMTFGDSLEIILQSLKQLLRKDQKVVIDSCHLRKEERSRLLECIKSVRTERDRIGCIWFDLSVDLCKARYAKKNESSLSKSKMKKTLDSFASLFSNYECPDEAEAFDSFFRIRSDLEFFQCLESLGCSMKPELKELKSFIHKFPRTHHLLNLGGTSMDRDDLIVESEDTNYFFGPKAMEVLVQEKIDGANLGISLTEVYEFRFQNRSHFINHETAAQWSKLKDWVETHRADLMRILIPGRLILFGEWCYHTHSVQYSKLSDYFLAFDMFDKVTQSFWSFDRLTKELTKCSIPIHTVPVICKRKFSAKEELLLLLENKSSFTDGFLEGIYLRIEDNGIVKKRTKLVRPDFLKDPLTHWSKQMIKKNMIEYKSV